tara:strand:- start:668 stop:1552 length:885 start_codon:yes stop_codon:yes gene_type:complete
MSPVLYLPFILALMGFGITAILYYYRAQIAAHVPNLGWVENVSFRKIGLFVGLAVLVLFWSPIADWVVTFLVASDAGVATGVAENDETQSFIRTWFWTVPLIGAWLWWKKTRPTKLKKIGGTVSEDIALIALGVPFLAVVALVALLIGFPVMGIVDAFTDGAVNRYFMRTQALVTGQEYVEPVQVAAADDCTTTASLEGVVFSPRGTAVLVCPEAGPFIAFSRYGQQLRYDLNDAWRNENQQILNGRLMADLVKLEAPFSFPGSIATSWKLIPMAEIRNAGIRGGVPMVIYGTE